MRSHPAPRASAPRANRRQRVPPALTRGSGRVDAILILDEIPSDLGLILWRSARNVLLWAETPAERRASLFPDTAARARGDELAHVQVPAEVRGPLSVLAELLARPAEVDLMRLVNACKRLSAWAEQRGSLATAVEFAQAAALAAPDSASLAYAVGRLARRRADYDRAESWYTRAAVQGRHTGDWHSYALAFSGIGNVNVARGNFPAARRWHLRCLRASERHGLIELMGDSYHALFALDVETGAGFECERLATAAFNAYGPRHPKVVRLAYDVAYHWAVLGDFAAATRVAAALVPRMNDAEERLAAVALLARAAAGLGDTATFDSMLDEGRVLLLHSSTASVAALSLLGFAHGASSLRRPDLTIELAERAAATAASRSQWRVALEAESVADAARADRLVQTAADRPALPRPLATRLALALAAVAVPA